MANFRSLTNRVGESLNVEGSSVVSQKYLIKLIRYFLVKYLDMGISFGPPCFSGPGRVTICPEVVETAIRQAHGPE